MSTNKGIAIDREERFKVYKKKLSDQSAYCGHSTLDLNSLPRREMYRYSSFGKDKKKCLKEQYFQGIGPGSGGYRLPSVFDKYC